MNKQITKDQYFIVKVLIPTDQFQCEYKAFYLGPSYTLVASILNATKYDNFDYALDDSKMITDKYKKVNEWAPAYVIKKYYNNNDNNSYYDNNTPQKPNFRERKNEEYSNEYEDEYI